MTVTPQDFTAGLAPTVDDVNSYLVTSIQTLLNPPHFRAFGTGSEAIPVGSTFGPTWVVQEDTHNGYSTAHKYYVAPVAGWYAVSSTIFITQMSASSMGAYCLVQASAGVQQPPVMFTRMQAAQNPQAFTLYADIYLQQGDWVFPVFQSNSTLATLVYGTADLTSFEVTWFGS